MLIVPVVAHVGLHGTAFFYPVVIWGVFALVVVTGAIDEVAALDLVELD